MLLSLLDVVIDFETHYTADYTLRKLTMTEYINDPRFEAIGVSIGVAGRAPVWVHGADKILRALSKIPWDRTRFIAHNAMFDGAILEWRYGFHPAKYLCTMMGSRPYCAPYTGSMSLAQVAGFFGVGNKTHVVEEFQGYKYSTFTPDQIVRYGAYSNNDNALSGGIAQILDRFLPPDEADLIDLTVKKYTRPKLVLDLDVIEFRLADLSIKRMAIEDQAAKYGCPPSSLRSRDKFAAALAKLGFTAKLKTSPRTGKPTFAFAKQDEGMAELLVHSDVRVRTLAEAKIFSSSTMESKRLERFKQIHALDIGGEHKLPVPLLYYGAHPGRLSGYDKINLQSLTRVKRDKRSAEVTAGYLRFALKAPPGYSVVAADLSNIEARLVSALARCQVLTNAFAQKKDIYCEFASKIYGRTITKADEVERFVGKTCILGLGYGMGWQKFALQMKIARVKMPDDAYRRIVYLYRDTYQEIPVLWSQLELLASTVMVTNGLRVFGPLTFAHERILLPNGMSLIYPGIQNNRSKGRLTFTSMRSGKATELELWGGAFTENICQALARIIITTAEVKLARLGLKAALQVHDELVYVVPTGAVPKVIKAIDHVLCTPVPWLPNLPIACEIKSGPSYGDAK